MLGVGIGKSHWHNFKYNRYTSSIGAYASIIENESQTGKMHQSFSSPIDFNVHNSVFLSRAKIRFCMLVSLVLNTEDAHSSVL